MENKFYKIGEIVKMLEVPASTLRYWETEFYQLKPIKSSGGQRFYNQKHIDLITNLKNMLYAEKYTIDGVKKRLKTSPIDVKAKIIHENTSTASEDNILISQNQLKKELEDILSILK